MRRQRIGMLRTIGMVIALVLGGVRGLAAQPIVVTSTVDDGEPGSLREAIASAVSGATVSIEPVGCSPCTIALTLGELVIDKNLTIVGRGPNLLTVSGEGASRVFRIAQGVVAHLQGLQVQDGNGVGALSFTGVDGGGGILNDGTLTLLDVVVTNNRAWVGGGTYSYGPLTIRNSRFTGNRAGSLGGAIVANDLLMLGSSIVGNATEDGSGGGVDVDNAMIIGTTIAGNTATASDRSDGGGLYISGDVTLVNCTISGNSADRGAGAAFHSFGGTLTLVNTTVTANSGGLESFGPNTIVLNNSIVAGNSPFDVDGGLSGTVINNSSQVGGDAANILNPMLANNGGATPTHALVPGSPAINAGDAALLPLDTFDVDSDQNTSEVLPIDQRGAPRVSGASVDQGAFEVMCTAISVTPPTLATAPAVGVAFSQTFSASGGTGPYAFTATGLPQGLALNRDTGVLSGTPTASGTYTITVTVADAFGCIGTQSYTVTIADPGCGIVLGPTTLATPYLATLYYQPLPITPAGAYTVRVSTGALPPGVYLFAIGHQWFLGGLPTKAGAYTFTLSAKKKNSSCAPTRTYTVTVPATVLPQLTCVAKTGAKQYTARFGYDNSTDAAVAIPVGASNYFTPGAQDRGQVTTFQKGRVTNAFSVVFTVKNNNTDLALWYLRGPDGVKRPVNITTATSRCQ